MLISLLRIKLTLFIIYYSKTYRQIKQNAVLNNIYNTMSITYKITG